jgi:heterodisulfide reductase subunit C
MSSERKTGRERFSAQWQGPEFLREVEARSGTPVSACYQCHKCSTGCPIGPEMDLLSSQVMRLIHLGAEREVLESKAIWLCASCEACTTRCPMGIDIAAVMDALRVMAVDREVRLPDARGEQFNRSFLNSVRRHSRVYELGMMMAYKLRSRDLLADSDKARRMLAKGKLSLLPKRSGSTGEVREVFRRAEKEAER